MKFDVTKYREIPTNTLIANDFGQLKINVTHTARVWVGVEGGEPVLAATGTSCDLTIRPPFNFLIETDEADGKAFLYHPEASAMKNTGEVYTNVDRKPHESGTVLEVRRAMREMQIRNYQERQHQAEIFRQRRKQLAEAGKVIAEQLPEEKPQDDQPDLAAGTLSEA